MNSKSIRKPRTRKPKPAAAVPAPTTPPCVCPECQRLLEIERRVEANINNTIGALRDAIKYLEGHNYTTILSYLNNAMQYLSPAVDQIHKVYQEQETARRVGK
jgi:hypothetical protein